MPNEQSRGPVVNETRGMVPPVAPVARPATAVPLSDPGTSGVGSQRSPQSGASPMVVRIDPLPAAPAKPSTPAKPDDKR